MALGGSSLSNADDSDYNDADKGPDPRSRSVKPAVRASRLRLVRLPMG